MTRPLFAFTLTCALFLGTSSMVEAGSWGFGFSLGVNISCTRTGDCPPPAYPYGYYPPPAYPAYPAYPVYPVVPVAPVVPMYPAYPYYSVPAPYYHGHARSPRMGAAGGAAHAAAMAAGMAAY